MTEELMKRGKEGAEVLSGILNTLFEDLIEAVYSRGGIISTFAGDAFTVLFPGEDKRTSAYAAAYSALAFQRFFARHGRQETRFGSFQLAAKVGLGLGEVKYGILGTKGLRAYYYRGEAVTACATAEAYASPGMIVATNVFCQAFHADDLELKATAEGFSQVLSLRRPEIDPPTPSAPDVSSEVLAEFFPQAVINFAETGEFRRVVSIFLSLQEPEGHTQLDTLIGGIRQTASEYGAYFNSLDFGDKGCTVLILFGAPVSHEDDSGRAGACALAIRDKLGQAVRGGITTGTVYAGMVGSQRRSTYTVLGDVINLSARLMMSADPGELLFDEGVLQSLPSSYESEAAGARQFKGIATPVSVFRLTGRGEGPVRSTMFSANLIGRTTELAELEGLLAPLSEGRFAGAVRVYGDAGCGKSHLLDQLARRHPQYETVFLPADGILRKGFNPLLRHLAAFFEALISVGADDRRAHFETRFAAFLTELQGSADPRMPELADELRRTQSLLGALLGIHWPDSLYERLDPQRRFENTLIAIKDLFRARSLQRPLVIVFEDAQWLDEDTQALIETLSRRMDDFPLALIAVGRAGDDGGPPSVNFAEGTHITDLLLGSIPGDEHSAYLTERLGGTPDQELLDFIASKTEGNPFYMDQFCLYLTRNALIKSNGVMTLAAATEDLPGGVASLLTARLDRMPGDLRSTVQSASVLGRDFEADILAQMMGRTEVADLLMRGEKEQLWTKEEGGLFRFRQSLLRDAAYEMQLREKLRELHGRAGTLIEQIGADDETRFADLAFHFEAAESTTKAIVYLQKAADSAQKNYKNQRALDFYQRLLQYVETPSERTRILMRESEVYDVTGQWDRAIELLEQARAFTTGDEAMAASIKVRLGEVLQKQGNYEQAASLLEEAAETADRQKDGATAAAAFTFLGRTRWSMGRYEPAAAALERAIAQRRELSDDHGLALALYYAGVVDRDRGRYEAALQRYDESLSLFQKGQDRMYVTYPIYDLGVIALYRGDLTKALTYFEQANAIYEEVGYQSGRSAALLNLGVIEARSGRLDSALEFYQKSLALAEEIGERLAIAYTLFSIGTVHYQKEDFAATLEYFERAFAPMKAIGARGYYGYVYSYLSCAYARHGKPTKALRAALLHFRNIREVGSDVENGRTHLGVALALSALGNRLPPNAAAAVAEIAKETGLPGEPAAHFEKAISTAEAARFVTTLIPAQREYALYLLSLGTRAGRDRAASLIEQALVGARGAGMQLEVARLERDADRPEFA